MRLRASLILGTVDCWGLPPYAFLGIAPDRCLSAVSNGYENSNSALFLYVLSLHKPVLKLEI